MGLLNSIVTAWQVGSEVKGAVDAARAKLAAGAPLLHALDAFAAATDGKLDDTVVADLRLAARQALHGARVTAELLHQGVTWLDEHRESVRVAADAVARLAAAAPGAVDRLLELAVSVGAVTAKATLRIEALGTEEP
jgi:hypothetical protein